MRPDDVLEYWFGAARTDASVLPERMRWWFGHPGDTPADVAARDAEMAARLGGYLTALRDGALDVWPATPGGRLAAILVADQLPRNIHRGRPDAFATDALARALCVEGIRLGHDAALEPIERLFFYLPLEHSESLPDQELGVAQIKCLERAAPAALEDAFAGFTRHAISHRDIVARFGRFPHRNRTLGRASTAEEERYLADDAPRFGQG